MNRHMHANSLAAYRESGEEFGERARMVFAAVRHLGRATDREVMAHLRFTDPNAVRPRVTELVQAGALVECGDVRDNKTGKSVRVVRIAGAVGQQELQLQGAA